MSTKDSLYAPFQNIQSRKGRGGVYDYVTWKDIADRMNEVFGVSWSSEIKSQDIVGDNIVVRVRVTISDPETGQVQYQEGFGGAKNDEAAEAGNPFKSAYSKALKDACKKWGVGLYLEDESETSVQSSIPPGFTGKEYGVPPAQQPMTQKPEPTPMSPPAGAMMPPPSVEMKTSAPSVPQTPQVEVEQTPFVPDVPPMQQAPEVPKASTPPMPEIPVQVPPTQVSQSVPQVPQSPQTPMQMPTSVNLSAGEKPLGSKMAINTGGPEYISDVQKAALHSILSIKGVDYQSLAAEAFESCGIIKTPIPPPDDLTYQEAVCIVKYGNDKFRRR